MSAYWLRPIQNIGDIVIRKFNSLFYHHKHHAVGKLVCVVLCGIIFTLFVMPTHFLGDGYMQIDNLGSEQFVIHKWSERGITLTLDAIQTILGGRSVENARLAFQGVSIVSGIVSVYFMFLIAGLIGHSEPKRYLIFFCLLFSGVMLLFFGYAESYPLLWPLLLGFTFFALKYIETGKGFLWACLFYIAAVFIHLYMIVFIPALVYMTLCTGRGRELYNKLRVLIGVVIIGMTSGSIYLLLSRIRSDLFIENIFLAVFSGKAVSPGYYIFSLSHIADILNLAILVSPILVLLVLLTGKQWKKSFNKPSYIFLWLFSGGSLAFLFVIDPQLTMPRDWDLFAPSFIGPTILALLLIPDIKIEKISGRIVPITMLSGLLILPFMAANLIEASSVDYHKYIINLDKSKSISSFIVLRSYYEKIGDQEAVDSLNAIYPKYYPDAVKLHRASDALKANDLQTAREMLSSVTADKFSSSYRELISGLYYKSKDYVSALDESDKAYQLEKFNSDIHRDRAVIFIGLKNYDSALVWLHSAYSLNDKDLFTLEALAWLEFKAGDYTSSAQFANHAIEQRGAGYAGYYWLAKMAALKGNRSEFISHIESYRQKAKNDPAFRSRLEELQGIFNNL